jgi:hypothetical protein
MIWFSSPTRSSGVPQSVHGTVGSTAVAVPAGPVLVSALAVPLVSPFGPGAAAAASGVGGVGGLAGGVL